MGLDSARRAEVLPWDAVAALPWLQDASGAQRAHRRCVFDALNEVLADVWRDRYRDRVLGEEARVERLALAGALEPGGALAAAPLKEYVGDRVRGTLCAFADTFATDPNDMSGLALEEDEDWHGIDDVLLGIKARVADDLLGDLAEEAMAEVLRVREALRRRGESAAATNNGH